MSVKTFAAKILANYIHQKLKYDSNKAVYFQNLIFKNIILKAKDTQFGTDHNFKNIKNYNDFKNQVPIKDYEGLRPYIDRILLGKTDVLWPGLPLYFAKTSGTTSGTKYIPITKDSISNHISSARNMLLNYVYQKGNAEILNGKLIFLQGSPDLKTEHGINIGRLSGIVAHHVPKYLQKNRLPSWGTNCMEDWERKIDAIVEETKGENMTLISGIPPWVQMYFDRLNERTGKTVGELFPNFNLLVHGGVNFAPYKSKLLASIGRNVDILETYPASEGFIAFQDNYQEEGLYLNVNSGIFFEFIPVAQYGNENAARLKIDEVALDTNYALILSSNAGLWAYNIGDTVKFVSLNPFKIVVTGRIKHFISAFGEHVIAKEVSDALAKTCFDQNCKVVEFTVAPQVNPQNGLPYHEWFIEFDSYPQNLHEFARSLNQEMCETNSYYNDLIKGNILRPLVLTEIQKGGFNAYMSSIGKLGGQNKVPKLGNDRIMANLLSNWKL